MPRCEMCGASSESLTTVKISQAELDVCSDCEDMGSPVNSDPTVDDAETKYSTDTSTESEESDSETDSVESSSPSMGMSELRADYGSVLRDAREEANMSLADLADELNKKESHLRQIEQENRQPTEELQEELEDFLDVELSMESDFTDFEDDDNSSGQTLGDVADFDL